MKVYIVHPRHDYGVESVHATREGAEAHKAFMEEQRWDAYRDRVEGNESRRRFALDRSAFIDSHYIQEFKVLP